MTVLALKFNFKGTLKLIKSELFGFVKFIANENQPKKPQTFDNSAVVFLTCKIGGTMTRTFEWNNGDKFVAEQCYACGKQFTVPIAKLIHTGKVNEQVCDGGHYYHADSIRKQ